MTILKQWSCRILRKAKKHPNLSKNEAMLLYSPFYCLFQCKIFQPFQWFTVFLVIWKVFIQGNCMNTLTSVCLKGFEILSHTSLRKVPSCWSCFLPWDSIQIHCLTIYLQPFLFICFRSPASLTEQRCKILLSSYYKFQIIQ